MNFEYNTYMLSMCMLLHACLVCFIMFLQQKDVLGVFQHVSPHMKCLKCTPCVFSMSLHLGDEVFDMYSMPMQGSFNHLFIRQGTGLMGQSIFKSKLTFRY